MSNKNVDEAMKQILTFKTPDEKLEFQCDMIQLGIIYQINLAMEELGGTKKDIAKVFSNTYGEKLINDFIADLFTCDAVIDLKDLALFQQALGIRFTFGYEVKEEK